MLALECHVGQGQPSFLSRGALCLPHVYPEKVPLAPLVQLLRFLLTMGGAVGGVDQCGVICKHLALFTLSEPLRSLYSKYRTGEITVN